MPATAAVTQASPRRWLSKARATTTARGKIRLEHTATPTCPTAGVSAVGTARGGSKQMVFLQTGQWKAEMLRKLAVPVVVGLLLRHLSPPAWRVRLGPTRHQCPALQHARLVTERSTVQHMPPVRVNFVQQTRQAIFATTQTGTASATLDSLATTAARVCSVSLARTRRSGARTSAATAGPLPSGPSARIPLFLPARRVRRTPRAPATLVAACSGVFATWPPSLSNYSTRELLSVLV